MRVTTYASFVFVALTVAALAVPTSYAGGWGWNRDAGSKARGEFGGKSARERGNRSYRYSYRGYDYQPRVDSRQGQANTALSDQSFKAGDRVVVATDSAPLMIGTRSLGAVPKGTEFAVLKVQGPWVGASVQIDGQTKSGWVPARTVTVLPHALTVSAGAQANKTETR